MPFTRKAGEGRPGGETAAGCSFSPFPRRERGRGKGGANRRPFTRLRAKGGPAAILHMKVTQLQFSSSSFQYLEPLTVAWRARPFLVSW